MANIFVHFEPFDVNEEKVQDGDVASQLGEGGDLPPYIIPNSPEAEYWKKEYRRAKKRVKTIVVDSNKFMVVIVYRLYIPHLFLLLFNL